MAQITADQVNSYQVDALKDDLEELEENLYRLQKDFRDKSRSYDLLKRDFKELERENEVLKETLREKEQIVEDHGLVILTNGDSSLSSNNHLINGDNSLDSVNDEINLNNRVPASRKTSLSGPALISHEVAEFLNKIQGLTVEAKLKQIAIEKEELVEEVRQLKSDLEQEKQKNAKLDEIMSNGFDAKYVEAQRENNKLVHEYRFKLKKAEQEVSTLQSTVARLKNQLLRYKEDAEEAEKLENDLKAEKRKVLRDLREAQARIEELETSNAHLQKRIDKIKTSRLAIINSS